MIKKEAEIFGLLFLRDYATISICSLLNIMASGGNIPVAIFEIVDYQGNLADGNKKYGKLICNPFLKNMKKLTKPKIYQILSCLMELRMFNLQEDF